MQIVIDIPDNYFNLNIENGSIASQIILKAVKNGIPFTDCTDAISREEVKELLDEYYAELTLDETALKSNAIAIKVTRHIINDIEALPSVNPTINLSKIRAEIEEVPTVKPCPPLYK